MMMMMSQSLNQKEEEEEEESQGTTAVFHPNSTHSPLSSSLSSDDLPTNVGTVEQLQFLPEECLNYRRVTKWIEVDEEEEENVDEEEEDQAPDVKEGQPEEKEPRPEEHEPLLWVKLEAGEGPPPSGGVPTGVAIITAPTSSSSSTQPPPAAASLPLKAPSRPSPPPAARRRRRRRPRRRIQKLQEEEEWVLDLQRPLRHLDEQGHVTTYSLHPSTDAVLFILIMEFLERLSFYGIQYTMTLYLTGAYNAHWQAGLDAVPASSYVSISTAVAYTMPFAGAFLADYVLGEFGTILLGSVVFYLPGLFLLASTTVPGWLGPTFNRTALSWAVLGLWPVGTGLIKSVVNVFGAKQFHPLLQSSWMESYYVRFYMCINMGALLGGIALPLLAQRNVTYAYFIPVLLLSGGVLAFAGRSSHYVHSAPTPVRQALAAWWQQQQNQPNPPPLSCCGRRRPAHPWATSTTKPPLTSKPVGSQKQGSPTASTSALSSSPSLSSLSAMSSSLWSGMNVIVRISLLVIPFNIAYSQMATTFVLQGSVMAKAWGWIDAASMNNADAVSVLLFGYVVGSQLYPWLAAMEPPIKMKTTHKFALGSALGSMAIAWALLVEYKIHYTYHQFGDKVSIWWQAMSYMLIGAGEIFAVSAAYEVAFTAAPPEQKVLASAVNLFCVGGLPNVLCIFLYQACQSWFRNQRGTTSIVHISDYATAHISHYFWLLLAISLVGVLVNLLPSVTNFVESIEEKAVDMLKSPKTPARPPLRALRREGTDVEEDRDDEESPLLRARRHQAYLKYGSGPSLVKHGSMRAGPSLSQRNLFKKKQAAGRAKSGLPSVLSPADTIKRSVVAKLYGHRLASRIHGRGGGGGGGAGHLPSSSSSSSTAKVPSSKMPNTALYLLQGAGGKPLVAGDLLPHRRASGLEQPPAVSSPTDLIAAPAPGSQRVAAVDDSTILNRSNSIS